MIEGITSSFQPIVAARQQRSPAYDFMGVIAAVPSPADAQVRVMERNDALDLDRFGELLAHQDPKCAYLVASGSGSAAAARCGRHR